MADVVTGEEADSVFYGVVQTATRSLVEDNGADVLQRVAVMCTDGITRTVNVDKSLNYPAGWMVRIDVTPEGENVTAIENRTISGTVSADAPCWATVSWQTTCRSWIRLRRVWLGRFVPAAYPGRN